MKKLKSTLESNSQQYKLTDEIIGFAGVNEKDNLERKGKLIKINSDLFSILIYFRPSDQNHHKPQDSVGIYIENETIRFAIADGVSIIQGTTDNESELLSLNLVKSLTSFGNQSIKKVSEEFLKENHIGASTLIKGEVNLKDLNLDIHIVSDNKDLGITKIQYKNKFETLRNKSWGFLPIYYESDSYKLDLPEIFSLIFSTDGIDINDFNLKYFLKFLRDEPDLTEIEKFLLNIMQPSSDDQSMIILVKN